MGGPFELKEKPESKQETFEIKGMKPVKMIEIPIKIGDMEATLRIMPKGGAIKQNPTKEDNERGFKPINIIPPGGSRAIPIYSVQLPKGEEKIVPIYSCKTPGESKPVPIYSVQMPPGEKNLPELLIPKKFNGGEFDPSTLPDGTRLRVLQNKEGTSFQLDLSSMKPK